MPTIKNLTEDIAAVVGLPEDTNTYGIGIAAMYSGMPYLCYDTKHSIGWDIKIHIPPGSWSIVGWSDELTGGQIYELGLTVREFKESLRSHGIDRALIIKKEK